MYIYRKYQRPRAIELEVHGTSCPSLVPRPSFLFRGEGEKRAWYTLSAHASKSPRNPGASDSSVKYHVYCPCNERKLSVILLVISTVRLLWTLAGIFLHENRSCRLLLSRRGSRASSKPKFGGTRRRV